MRISAGQFKRSIIIAEDEDKEATELQHARLVVVDVVEQGHEQQMHYDNLLLELQPLAPLDHHVDRPDGFGT